MMLVAVVAVVELEAQILLAVRVTQHHLMVIVLAVLEHFVGLVVVVLLLVTVGLAVLVVVGVLLGVLDRQVVILAEMEVVEAQLHQAHQILLGQT
jgi:hypothetical protein